MKIIVQNLFAVSWSFWRAFPVDRKVCSVPRNHFPLLDLKLNFVFWILSADCSTVDCRHRPLREWHDITGKYSVLQYVDWSHLCFELSLTSEAVLFAHSIYFIIPVYFTDKHHSVMLTNIHYIKQRSNVFPPLASQFDNSHVFITALITRGKNRYSIPSAEWSLCRYHSKPSSNPTSSSRNGEQAERRRK